MYASQSVHRSRRGNCRKAGVFMYDPEEDRVLLVQSRGQLWGPPKGTLEMDNNETSLACAIRELKEETGLDVCVQDFSRAIKIKNRSIFYYTERSACEVHVQNHEDEEKNDANGITWIKLDCLDKCIKNGRIVLNQHGKICFKKFLNREFPKSEFIIVERKH